MIFFYRNFHTSHFHKMAYSSASPTALMDKCLNCMVYKWVQPDLSILQQCKQCKIVQYCISDPPDGRMS